MKGLSGNLGYLLWFVVVFAGGFHLISKSNEVKPEIQARARLITALEKAVVAARVAAREKQLDSETLAKSLLAHGIKSRSLFGLTGAEIRMTVRLSPKEEGRLEIRKGNGGRRVATAFTGNGRGRLELRALLHPPGER